MKYPITSKRIRTSDLRLRRPLLYPAELWTHVNAYYIMKTFFVNYLFMVFRDERIRLAFSGVLPAPSRRFGRCRVHPVRLSSFPLGAPSIRILNLIPFRRTVKSITRFGYCRFCRDERIRTSDPLVPNQVP